MLKSGVRKSTKELFLISIDEDISACNYEQARQRIKDSLGRWPNDHHLEYRLAETYAKLGDIENALRWYRSICDTLKDKTPRAYLRRIHYLANEIGNDLAVNDLFSLTASSESIRANNCYKELINGNLNLAKIRFQELMRDVFADSVIEESWIDSFECLCKIREVFISRSRLWPKVNILSPKLKFEYSSKQRKIFIAGMGWSGASAVYDYFREFDSIVPVGASIAGELQHITGFPSLKSLRRAADSSDEFCRHLIFFFGNTLLGLGVAENLVMAKTIAQTQSVSFSESCNTRKLYAEVVNSILKDIEYQLESSDDLKINLTQTYNKLIDGLADAFGATAGSIALFDNAINVRNIQECYHFENANFIFVFRDPRSNFVSYVKGDKVDKLLAQDYIKQYRRIRRLCEAHMGDKFIKDRAHFVTYEKFVLSDSFRKDLALKIGLDLVHHTRKELYFIPEESKKRVTNYESYSFQADIAAIKSALPEYCS